LVIQRVRDRVTQGLSISSTAINREDPSLAGAIWRYFENHGEVRSLINQQVETPAGGVNQVHQPKTKEGV
jgi:hypothetical protein